MILTGDEIIKEAAKGNIFISPFCEDSVNPNSYNYRLGNKLKVFKKQENGKQIFSEVEIPEDGIILYPKQTYLGHTAEIIGSDKYAMSLIGRSSLGRCGLFLQVSANLGHTLSCHQWTLELVALKPIKLYRGMKIGQVSFWVNQGKVKMYDSYYNKYSNPLEAKVRVSNDPDR